MSEKSPNAAPIDDIVKLGKSGDTYHRPDGKFLSNYEVEAIRDNADLIRNNLPAANIGDFDDDIGAEADYREAEAPRLKLSVEDTQRFYNMQAKYESLARHAALAASIGSHASANALMTRLRQEVEDLAAGFGMSQEQTEAALDHYWDIADPRGGEGDDDDDPSGESPIDPRAHENDEQDNTPTEHRAKKMFNKTVDIFRKVKETLFERPSSWLAVNGLPRILEPHEGEDEETYNGRMEKRSKVIIGIGYGAIVGAAGWGLYKMLNGVQTGGEGGSSLGSELGASVVLPDPDLNYNYPNQGPAADGIGSADTSPDYNYPNQGPAADGIGSADTSHDFNYPNQGPAADGIGSADSGAGAESVSSLGGGEDGVNTMVESLSLEARTVDSGEGGWQTLHEMGVDSSDYESIWKQVGQALKDNGQGDLVYRMDDGRWGWSRAVELNQQALETIAEVISNNR